MNDELVFYTNPMSRGRIVRWMLEEVGCPYRTELLDYGTTMKDTGYLAINPMGKVPAIVHRGQVVTETAAICAYLADAFPEANLAPPTAERADYYRWLFFAAGPIEAAFSNKAAGFEYPADKQGMAGYGTFDLAVSTLEKAVEGRAHIAAGRFTAARTFGPIDMPTWKSFAPRAGIVYDLFGNQKTAIKASFGKYMQAGTVGFSQSQNPLLLTTQTVAWTDLNGDGTPQGELNCVYLSAGCEINVAGNATTARQLPANFGIVAPVAYADDIKRMFNVESTVSVQHEVVRGVSVTAGYYRRNYYNLRRRFNTGVGLTDWTPYTLYSPIDGSAITYYNPTAAKASQVATNLVDQNSPDRSMKYTGFEYNFNARVGKGITLFGGGMSERMLTNTCDDGWNPNLLLYCDQSKSGIPYRTQFKIAGSIPVKYGVQVGLAFQSLPGYVYGTTSQYALTGVSGPSGITTNNPPNGQGTVWQITRTTAYTASSPCVAQGKCTAGQLVNPGLTQASQLVPLVAPMTEYGDRINQLDINVIKNIKIGRATIQPKLDIFNALNRAPVTSVLGLNYGTAAYNVPSVILNPRTIQIGANMRW